MIEKTFFDASTGRIEKCLRGLSKQFIENNAPDGCEVVDGYFHQDSFYIKNGQPVEYPPRPSQFCHFDFEAEQWLEDMDAHWRELRRERNARLAATDWTQVPDAPVDAAAWATYRQALRDLPANTDDPRNPAWPEQPE